MRNTALGVEAMMTSGGLFVPAAQFILTNMLMTQMCKQSTQRSFPDYVIGALLCTLRCGYRRKEPIAGPWGPGRFHRENDISAETQRQKA